VLAVARDPAAIGFVDLSQLPPKEKSVKLVPVFEGTKTGSEGPKRNAPHPDPLPTNLRSVPGEGAIGLSPPNPLSRTLTLYVSPKAGQAAKDFAAVVESIHRTYDERKLAEEAKLASSEPEVDKYVN